MAPFVEAEWGGPAFEIMARLKTLVDPDGLLNPGVLVNHDPAAHLKDLKSLPEVEEEVDRCIECGFCESLCPSRDLTLTPRQRIVVRRAMQRARRRRARPARGVRVRRARNLRDRRAVRARLPGVDRYGAADEAPAGVDAVGIRAARGGVLRANHFEATQRMVRAGLRCARERPAAPAPGRRRACHRRSNRPCRPPRRRCPRHERGRRDSHPLPVVRQPDDRGAARRIGRSIGAGRDDRRRRARRPAAAHSREHRAATVLRHAVRIEGIPRSAGDCRQRDDRGAVERLAGRCPARRRGHEPLRVCADAAAKD